MAFGNNLQYLRKMHRGMTQEELAEKMDVSRQTISKCTKGAQSGKWGALIRKWKKHSYCVSFLPVL